MSFILRHTIDDIAVTLKQTYDDKIIQRSQIAYWILLIGNTLKAQHIQKRSSGAFLTSFGNIPVTTDALTGRKYFVLPNTIYDFTNDGAIDCIAYFSDGSPLCPPQFTRQTFNRTTKKTSQRLYYSKYETPSPKNPFFYRISNKIYLLGLEKVNIPFLEVDLYTAFDPLTVIDIDQPFDFPDELMSILRVQVIALARYSYMFPQDRSNDGNDANAEKAVNTPKITSVNENTQAQA